MPIEPTGAESFEDTVATPGGPATDAAPPEIPGPIGPYRLISPIGEGGMGEVWLAEQREPVRRRVAVKIIKAGMDTKEVIARFESERQALALMDHPAIAKVFDGGSTPEGRPYFVMEHVAGIPIDEHCDRHRLSTVERLELFTEVCEGVQHAHQKAIIHRDLKPSNILVSMVDGKPQPKIIDFGIAKAIGTQLTEKTLFTALGSVIGTPEYMSPEQADSTGQDVDTRTDVYSLGVVLYQLLTGELPLSSSELRASGFEGLSRKLRESEPPRPSSRLRTAGDGARHVAAERRTDPGALARQLSGDLDAITLKALEKERGRRYGTSTELAEDIRRYLRHEPVVARPASLTYRLRKLVRRHRVGVAMATVLSLLLVAFSATMAIQTRRIAAERDRANHERETSEKAAAFLASMLSDVKPQVMGQDLWGSLHRRVAALRSERGAAAEEVQRALGRLDAALDGVSATDTAVQLLDQEILDRAGKTLRKDLAKDARLASRLEHTLGFTYINLGLYPQAEEHLQRAVALKAESVGPEHWETLGAKSNLARVYVAEGRYPEAERLVREVMEVRRRTLGPDDQSVLSAMNNLGIIYSSEGRYAEAETVQREVLAAKRRLHGPEHPETLNTLSNLANVLYFTGRLEEAESLRRTELEVERRVFGPDDARTLDSAGNLGAVLVEEGRLDEAGDILRRTVERERRALGPNHPGTLVAQVNLAAVEQRLGHLVEAEKLARQAVHGLEAVNVTRGKEIGGAREVLGSILLDVHRHPEAERELLEADRQLPARSIQHRHCLEDLVTLYERWGASGGGPPIAARVGSWKAKLATEFPDKAGALPR